MHGLCNTWSCSHIYTSVKDALRTEIVSNAATLRGTVCHSRNNGAITHDCAPPRMGVTFPHKEIHSAVGKSARLQLPDAVLKHVYPGTVNVKVSDFDYSWSTQGYRLLQSRGHENTQDSHMVIDVPNVSSSEASRPCHRQKCIGPLATASAV